MCVKALLIELEGFKLEVYLDSAGLPTIGVGHLLTQSERMSGKILINGVYVRYRYGLSETEVRDLLDQDLEKFEGAVREALIVQVHKHQFEALMSFAFNVGIRAFQKSTLLKRVNALQWEDVPKQLRRWVYSGGKRSKGLENRREKEIKHWQGE